MLSTFLLVLLVTLLLVFPTPIFYALFLIGIVFLVLSFSMYYSLLASLPVLLIIIIYVGAMMIVIGYVCSVCPNYYPSSSMSSYMFFIVLVVFLGSLGLNSLTFYSSVGYFSESSLIFSYFYLSSGVFMFFLVVVFMLIILLIASSLCMQSAPMRSLFY